MYQPIEPGASSRLAAPSRRAGIGTFVPPRADPEKGYADATVILTLLLIFGGLDSSPPSPQSSLASTTLVRGRGNQKLRNSQFSSINNAGPGSGPCVVGPARNDAGPTDYEIWVPSFTMLLGRLELLSLLVLFTPQFWRK